MNDRCACHDTLIVKNLNRWFKEKWVDVSRKDPKTGKHPPCGRSKAKKGSKGYPKCRPSVRVSSKTPKTSGEMTSGQKRAATKRKRAKKQGVGGKPTIVKSPMDLAWRLLKLELAPPMTQGVEDQVSMQEDIPMVDLEMGNYESPCECAERIRSDVLALIVDAMNNPEEYEDHFDEIIEMYEDWQGHSCQEILEWAETTDRYNYCNNNMSEADQMKYTGEPMDLAWRLLKKPMSPEAKRHKLEYDKKYESSPERVKYREELNRERRRRGIYGHGGPDMSHTKDHTLVAESPHANRARHFKERGTLKG